MKSKAILEKCQAEGIPGINNHMSSVSVGLEATIKEWFSEKKAESGSTAVETAEKVDLNKVRVKRARKKATPTGTSDSEAEAATAVAEPEKATPAEATPQETPGDNDGNDGNDGAETPESTTVETPPTPVARKIEAPKAEEEAEADATPETSEPETELQPAAAAPVDAPATDTDTDADADADADGASGEGDASPDIVGVPNVPTRPDVVKPVGRQLKTKTPAKLSGPKVIRVEQPDEVQQRRPRREQQGEFMPMNRGPRGGAGVGGPMMPPTEDDGRGSRRNKRRGGGGGGDSRGGGGGGGGGGRGSRRNDRGWSTKDLIEREARLSRSDGFLRQRRRSQKMKGDKSERPATLAETGGEVRITTPISIKDLSAATGVKAAEIVKKLFLKGIMANVNSGIEDDQAQEVMLDYNIELILEEPQSAEAAVVEEHAQRETVDERSRSPVVTILGHVDHGKTSLLDRIRKANVASGEAGGITQATSAFSVPVHVGDTDKTVTFLDTPGHEAFTEMRSRGANMTDLVVLVIAADDGVMPQTVESIAHARAAGVPIVVALNKTDLAAATDANIQRIFGQLAEQEVQPSEWGGDIEVVRTSAETGDGIQDLLEVLDYQAQLLELKADFGGSASGVIVESQLQEGRGPVANILIQQGQLSVGDIIVAGRAFGRVRDMVDHTGARIKTAHPSMPVQISGMNELPDAGDRFFVVQNLKNASEAAEQRRQFERERELSKPKMTLDTMFAAMQEADVKELRVILKADVQGSVDVIQNTLEEISTDEVKVRVLHAAVGGITESDVTLAAASDAVILGFNVIASAKARRMAEDKSIEVRSYQVIYDIVDDMKKAAEGLLEPEIRQEVLGHAEVRQVFRITKVGSVAGCYVTDGSIERNALIRVTRDDIVIENDRVLEQLKRFKDDAKEVRSGQECGMKIVGYDDIKEGDVLECYRKVEVRRSL